MRYFLSFISCLVCSASMALAQAPAAPKSGRTCRILFVSALPNAPKKIYLNDGVTSQEVELPTLNFSPVYKLASGNITLRLTPALPTDQQPIPAGAPSSTLADSVTDCYLLVASDPKNPVTPLQCQVINANPSGFRAGEMMWINLTPYLVGGQLGSKTLELKPNSQTIVGPPANEIGSYPVKIGYAPGKDRKANLIVSSSWNHDPDSRIITFVSMLPNSKSPQIKGYVDTRAPAAAQPSGQ